MFPIHIQPRNELDGNPATDQPRNAPATAAGPKLLASTYLHLVYWDDVFLAHASNMLAICVSEKIGKGIFWSFGNFLYPDV